MGRCSAKTQSEGTGSRGKGVWEDRKKERTSIPWVSGETIEPQASWRQEEEWHEVVPFGGYEWGLVELGHDSCLLDL